MINYERETITLQGKTEPILRWEVWWVTPEGLHQTLAEARVSADSCGIPYTAIQVAPAAVGETIYEVKF